MFVTSAPSSYIFTTPDKRTSSVGLSRTSLILGCCSTCSSCSAGAKNFNQLCEYGPMCFRSRFRRIDFTVCGAGLNFVNKVIYSHYWNFDEKLFFFWGVYNHTFFLFFPRQCCVKSMSYRFFILSLDKRSLFRANWWVNSKLSVNFGFTVVLTTWWLPERQNRVVHATHD